MPTPIQSKLVSERVSVKFNFTGEVQFLEAITSAYVDVLVLSGVDDSPRALLFSGSSIIDQTVTQVICLGTPGVIYEILCTVTGSSGKQYQSKLKLAVLSSPENGPPLFGSRYSSPPYQIIFSDGLDYSSAIQAGRWQVSPAFQDDILHYSSIVSGFLRDVINVYGNWSPEGLNLISSIQSGELRSIVVEYFLWPPEGLNHSSSIQAGTLKTTIIEYLNWPAESLNHSSSIISGTLA